MATTALSRNPTLGCIYRSLASKITLSQLRSTNPPFGPFHGFPPQSLLRPPLPQSEIHLDAIYRRFLCSSTSTATATASQASSSTGGSSEGNSGKGDKSDQSQNTSEQGKSVRGGVFFYSSLTHIYYSFITNNCMLCFYCE